MIEIKRIKSASLSYGDRAVEVRQPATYGIFRGGEQIGEIYSEPRRFMVSSEWIVMDLVRKVGRGHFKTLKAAKQRAQEIFS